MGGKKTSTIINRLQESFTSKAIFHTGMDIENVKTLKTYNKFS
jgi:hypothetical protein